MSNSLIQKDTVTFNSVNGQFQFTVKKSFLNNFWLGYGIEVDISDPESILKAKSTMASQQSVYDLMTKHNMSKYLHNITGPALINKESGEEQYWIDGVNTTKSHIVAREMKKDIMDILNEDSDE